MAKSKPPSAPIELDMFNQPDMHIPKILLVDDEAMNILILQEAVRDLGEVRIANDGKAALQMACDYRPDIMLLDIEMPGLSGYDVLQLMQSDIKLRDIAVVFVTSHSRPEHELHAMSSGGVDFLVKPLNLPIARARIKTHLDLVRKTKQLAAATRDLRDVVRNLPALIAQWNADLNNVFCNDIQGTWFGIPAQQIHGMHMRHVLGETNFKSIYQYVQAAANGESTATDIVFSKPDGTLLYGHVALVSHVRESADAGFLMLITDVTERRLAEVRLHNEKERIRITLNSIGDAVIATNETGHVTLMNPVAVKMTGWIADEAIGMPIEEIMPLVNSETNQIAINPVRLVLVENRTVSMAFGCALIRRDGHVFGVEDSAAPILSKSGALCGAIIVFHDVSESRAMAVKMTHLAHYDALTNLPNRVLLQDRMKQALFKARRSGDRVALCLLDLDHFKTINDAIGHAIGDLIIKEVGLRLQSTLRSCDTISRQGGDEFAILLPDLNNIEEVGSLAERLLTTVALPYNIDGTRYDLSASIGISIFPDDSSDVESLYRHADASMYKAKLKGRNRFIFFSSTIEENLRLRLTLERAMRIAIEEKRFEIHYQPKVDGRTNKIVGAEALVRWRKENGDLMSPNDFIPLAEETSLIIPIGAFVLRQACRDGANLHSQGMRIRIAVNVSGIQLSSPLFAQTIKDAIRESGITPHLLELEITEGALAMDDELAMRTLVQIKAIGVSIAIDDFGTGYSSLAYLKRYPIDVLKIDQSFIREMITHECDEAIVDAVINMANGLKLRLVAEGVETAGQVSLLLKKGCNVMQGYFFSRPVPFEQMRGLINFTIPIISTSS